MRVEKPQETSPKILRFKQHLDRGSFILDDFDIDDAATADECDQKEHKSNAGVLICGILLFKMRKKEREAVCAKPQVSGVAM